jgi:hypothetical protein
VVRFAGIALCVSASFAAAVYALVWVGDHDAESYGNRLLGAPGPQECRLARAIARDFAAERSAEARRAAGASDQKLQLLAYAWSSDGARAPPGADWRWCPGFGPYVRSLGLARMGSGDWWEPSLYVSRVPPAGPSGAGWAWVTFFAPQADDPRFGGRRWAGSTTWRVVYPPANRPAALPEWTLVARRADRR